MPWLRVLSSARILRSQVPGTFLSAGGLLIEIREAVVGASRSWADLNYRVLPMERRAESLLDFRSMPVGCETEFGPMIRAIADVMLRSPLFVRGARSRRRR